MKRKIVQIYIWCFIVFVLLMDSIAAARKIKRKGAYLPQATGPSSYGSEPYKYEEIHSVEYANHQPYSEHYEYEPAPQTTLSNTYLMDNGLRSIAKGSADQANSAVASQNAAAKQAAYVAKNTLAHAASQAANTAVAVLKGKEVLLQRLEEQLTEAHKTMQSELQQLQQAKRSAQAAQYAAEQAINHVSILTAALNNAQSASDLAQKAASEAAGELASQIDMVAQAKKKVEAIETQLYTTRLDYQETKDAAEKATYSAQAAQHNANDAALHANVELSASSGGSLQTLQDVGEHHAIIKRTDKHGRDKFYGV
uniref:Uncharacterized protein n=1 Tax=Glossina morsitans morsitans TaxID=37546 RepID=A0A1B0FGD2_GLOMM